MNLDPSFVSITLRLDRDAHTRLVRAAAESERDIEDLVEDLLEEAIWDRPLASDDEADIRTARERFAEIDADPSTLVSGEELERMLAGIMKKD